MEIIIFPPGVEDRIDAIELEVRENEKALDKMASAVEAKLYDMGLSSARCHGHYQVGVHIPDKKVISLQLGKHRNAVFICDHRDEKQIKTIADLFFNAFKARQ
jgi:hypothetical protein